MKGRKQHKKNNIAKKSDEEKNEAKWRRLLWIHPQHPPMKNRTVAFPPKRATILNLAGNHIFYLLQRQIGGSILGRVN